MTPLSRILFCFLHLDTCLENIVILTFIFTTCKIIYLFPF